MHPANENDNDYKKCDEEPLKSKSKNLKQAQDQKAKSHFQEENKVTDMGI